MFKPVIPQRMTFTDLISRPFIKEKPLAVHYREVSTPNLNREVVKEVVDLSKGSDVDVIKRILSH